MGVGVVKVVVAVWRWGCIGHGSSSDGVMMVVVVLAVAVAAVISTSVKRVHGMRPDIQRDRHGLTHSILLDASSTIITASTTAFSHWSTRKRFSRTS